MKSRNLEKCKRTFGPLGAIIASLGIVISCAGVSVGGNTAAGNHEPTKATGETHNRHTALDAASKSSAATKSPASTAPDFEGCDSPGALSRADRLAILEKITLESENEIASEAETTDASSPEEKDRRRLRIRTFAAGLMPDTVRFVSMDRSCWASFYGAKEKLASGDEIGALSESKEWKDCLSANFPDRVAVAQPYFSCFQSAPPRTGK